MDWPTEPSGLDVQEAWVQSAANALAWGIFGWGVVVAIVVSLAALAVRARRRRFWCHETQREVEVEFEERGFPGFRRPTAVLSCSVFEPPTAVRCRGSCLGYETRNSMARAPR